MKAKLIASYAALCLSLLIFSNSKALSSPFGFYADNYSDIIEVYQLGGSISFIDYNLVDDCAPTSYLRERYNGLLSAAPGICLSHIFAVLPQDTLNPLDTDLWNEDFDLVLNNGTFTSITSIAISNPEDASASVEALQEYSPTPGWLESIALGKTWIYNYATGDNSDNFGSWYYLPERGALYIRNAEAIEDIDSNGNERAFMSFYVWDHNEQAWLYLIAKDGGGVAYNFSTGQWQDFLPTKTNAN